MREQLVMGMDEAGRGSIVGPMVVAGVVLRQGSLKHLVENGVTDSKKLEPIDRNRLAEFIKKQSLWHAVVEVPPPLIDSMNLNRLTGTVLIYLAKRACRFLPLSRIVADMVKGVKPPSVECGGRRLVIRMSEKAEAIYVEVAAASILAKVRRDAIIEGLRRRYGVRGSGYPSDPRTLDWLRENLGRIPREIIRLKWSTVSRIRIGESGEDRDPH